MKKFPSLALMVTLLSPATGSAQAPATSPAEQTPAPATAPTPTPDLVPGATAGPADLTSPAPPPDSGLLPPPGALPEPGDALPGGRPRPKANPANDQAFKEAVENSGNFAAGRSKVDGPVISLEEALRITLARQPSIQLAQEDLEIARAGLQDAIGVFDTHLFSEISHGRAVSPQPDGQISAQKQARQALIDTYRGVKAFRAGQGSGKIVINNIDDKTGEVTGQRTIDITALGAGNATGGLEVNNLPQRSGGASASELQTLIQLQQQAAILNDVAQTSESAQLNNDLIDQIKGVEKVNKQILKDLQKGLKTSITNFSIQETSVSNNTKYELGLTKTFRNGVAVTPKVSFDKAGLTNNVKAEMEITVPLAQGYGGHFLRAFEDSAYYDLLGTELSLRHQISNSLLQTSLAYWNCVAALQNYILLRQSENISNTFVSLTSERQKSNEVAASEVSKASARSSTVLSQVIGAEFALLDARRQLAIAMGLEGAELNNPPFAAGEIPTDIPMGNLGTAMNEMVTKALACRADRAAALQQMRSGKVLADAAYRDIKPRFDFFFNFGMAANHDGSSPHEQFAAYTDKFVGASARGGFSFDWDIVNNPAKAAYGRNLAQFRQIDINTRDLERQITNGVLRSAAEIRMKKSQLAATIDAARFNRDILGAERQRYNDGEGSLLDTLQIEEQFTNALVSIVSVKLQFISAVSQLRYESGTLLDPLSGSTPSTVAFNPGSLSSIPDFEGTPMPPPLPTLDTDVQKRPQPLLTKLRGGSSIQSQTKVYNLAVSPQMKYRALTDAPSAPVPLGPVPVVTSKAPLPAAAPAPAPRTAVRSVPAEVSESAPAPVAAAPAPVPAPAPSGKKKPLLKRMFGN